MTSINVSSDSLHNLEHINQYGPVRNGIVFLDPVPAISRRSTRTTPGSSLKDGKSGVCELADDHDLLCLNDVFKPPVVRQWLSNGRLFREKEERTPSRFELIFDLILVGIVHQLADAASEQVSGLSLAKIILTFYPAWSIWSDYRNWQNMSGVDDVSQRIQTLAILICLVGYSSNASAIELHSVEGGAGAASAVSAVARRLFHRAAEAAVGQGSTATEAVVAEVAHHGQQHAIIAATAFFLIAKLIRIGTFLAYAWEMPDFRATFLARASALTVVSLIFMGCIWAPTLRATAILAAVGTAVEIGLRFSIGLILSFARHKWQRDMKKKAERGEKIEATELQPNGIKMIPAINLEHMVERTAAFVTIVIGESVISILYIAAPGTFGLSHQFARAVFGLTIAFIFNALFFDAALSKKFLHAIRRHWFTHIMWDITHWPLCTGLIVASAALTKLVQNEEVAQGIRWQYGGGMGTALVCITVLGILHQSLDPAGSSRLNAASRALIRFSVALIFTLLPLIKHITDLAFLGIYVAIASAMVIFEIWAKLGVEEVEREDHQPVEDEADAKLDKAMEAEARRVRTAREGVKREEGESKGSSTSI